MKIRKFGELILENHVLFNKEPFYRVFKINNFKNLDGVMPDINKFFKENDINDFVIGEVPNILIGKDIIMVLCYNETEDIGEYDELSNLQSFIYQDMTEEDEHPMSIFGLKYMAYIFMDENGCNVWRKEYNKNSFYYHYPATTRKIFTLKNLDDYWINLFDFKVDFVNKIIKVLEDNFIFVESINKSRIDDYKLFNDLKSLLRSQVIK